MSNNCLKVTTEKNGRSQNFGILGLKIFVARSVFGVLQLTQISLNFKSSCCNLTIRGLGAKLRVAFTLF